MMDRIKELIERIPWNILVILAVAVEGYQHYQWAKTPESPYVQKTNQAAALEKENADLDRRLHELADFIASLERKRAELRLLAQQLNDLKSSLSEDLDVPSFMKSTVIEAKRVGMNVLGLRPLTAITKEFYVEQPFDFHFHAVYTQLLLFIQHLSKQQRVVRADNLLVHPAGSNTARYVELDGTVQISTYRYLGSKADQIGELLATQKGMGLPSKDVSSATGGKP